MNELIRIIDADTNRACEGMRVLSDVARFVLNNASLAERAGALRRAIRDIASAKMGRGEQHLLDARNVDGDPDKDTTGERARSRGRLVDTVAASARRTQEALRSLEEFSAPLFGDAAAEYARLRFECYNLHAEIALALREKLKLDLLDFDLYLVVGSQDVPDEERLFEVVMGALKGGVGAVQLREKVGTKRRLLEIARRMRDVVKQAGAAFIVNDHVDVAAACDADGVHLGQDDLPLNEAKKMLPLSMIIGVSTHDLMQALAAQQGGADYINIGPIYATATKEIPRDPLGVKAFAGIAKHVRIPFTVMGGINEENVRNLVLAGAERIAVVSAIAADPDPAAATERLLQVIRTTKGERARSLST